MESVVADVIRIGGLELRFLVDETQGSGDLVIFEMTVHPNARVPVPHYHREVDEIIYGLSGTLTGGSTVRRMKSAPATACEFRAGPSITAKTCMTRRRAP